MAIVSTGTFTPSTLIITENGDYIVSLETGDYGGGNWTVGTRTDKPAPIYSADYQILSSGNTGCEFKISYRDVTFNFLSPVTVYVELHNTGNGKDYVYYYEYTLNKKAEIGGGTMGMGVFNPSALTITANGEYLVNLDTLETGGGIWRIAPKDSGITTGDTLQYSIVSSTTIGCKFKIKYTNTDFENIPLKEITLELHNRGIGSDYIYNYKYTVAPPEDDTRVMEGTADFNPATLSISANNAYYVDVTALETDGGGNWSVSVKSNTSSISNGKYSIESSTKRSCRIKIEYTGVNFNTITGGDIQLEIHNTGNSLDYIYYYDYKLVKVTAPTTVTGSASFDPSVLTISGSGSYLVNVTAVEMGGGNWTVGLRKNFTTSYAATYSIIADNSNTCSFRINYDTFTYNGNEPSIIRLELHNTGGDTEYIYYYDYTIAKPDSGGSNTGTTGTSIVSGTATFNPAVLEINKNGTYTVNLYANETGGGNWTVGSQLDKPFPANTDVQFTVVDGRSKSCEFQIKYTNTNFENITDRQIYLELHNKGGEKEYVYYYDYKEEKAYPPIQNSIEFSPSNFIISAATSGVVNTVLTSNKELDFAVWSVKEVPDTGVELDFTQIDEYRTSLVIDASSLSAATTGTIQYNVTYTYIEENGDVVNSGDTFAYYYRIIDTKPDSTPTLSFNPSTVNISGDSSVNLYATVAMNDNTIISTTWNAEITGNTQLNYSFTRTGTTGSTLSINSNGATKNENGYIRYSVVVRYKSNDNTEKTKTVTANVPYYLKLNEVPMQNNIRFTPTSINKMAGDVDFVYSNLTSNKQFTNVVWDAIVVGNTNLQIDLTQNNFYETTLRIDSSNALSGESGTIRYTAQFSYVGVDNNTITTAQTFDYYYTYTENSGLTPSIPVELIASPSTLVLNDGVSVLTINSNTDIVDWNYMENSYLNVSYDNDSTNRQGIFYVSPKNGIDDTITTNLTLRAYINTDRTKYTDISVPVIIMNSDVLPVWRNNLLGLNTEIGSNVKYSVVDVSSNNILYSGRIVKLPNGGVVGIDISKIVGNYLSNHFPNTLPEGLRLNDIDDYAKTVNIYVNNNLNNTLTIYNSWGYDDIPYTNIISDPIRKVVDKRQMFVCSVYNPTTVSTTVRYQLKNGNNTTNRATITANNNKQVLITDNGLKNTSYNEIVIGDLKYKIIESCNEWCLYYSNAYGGWDSLLVNGNVLKDDKITSHYYKQAFNNTTYQFEKTKYLNVINPTYVLYTDWFNDDEQSRLYHLLESTEVYLHNMVTGEFLPVNITNTDCQYKTFTNNGKKKWYNTINVEVAQERIRK